MFGVLKSQSYQSVSKGELPVSHTGNPNEGPHVASGPKSVSLIGIQRDPSKITCGTTRALLGSKRKWRRQASRCGKPLRDDIGNKSKGRHENSRCGELFRAETAGFVHDNEGGSWKRARFVCVAGEALGVAAAEAELRANEARRKADEAALLRNLNTAVISLDRRPDRMDGFRARCANLCPDLQFQSVSAVDGRATTIGTNMVSTSWDTTENVVYQRLRSERKGWDDLHTYHERILELSPGERGCAASHIKVWRDFVASGSEAPLLVLEDDAAPVPDFAGVLSRALAALPDDAQLLYLGYSQAAEWRRTVSPDLVEAEYVWTTVGYILWPSTAKLLLSKLPIDQPVDNWLALMCARGELKSYCVRPKIIRQADAWNCGSDIAHSDENYWGPDSDIMHSDVVPVPTRDPLARSVPGAIFDDGSSFWDLTTAQKEHVS